MAFGTPKAIRDWRLPLAQNKGRRVAPVGLLAYRSGEAARSYLVRSLISKAALTIN